MTPEESYLFFLKNCTTANKSADNYKSFARINETIARLEGLPSFDIYSILEVSELDRIIESLQNDKDFLTYNSKGNNQYINALAYYRRYLPYFRTVRDILRRGVIGKVLSIQIRFAVPPRDLDYNDKNLPWRVQADIAGGGYFYDLAPHQLDLLQEMFGPIIDAEGYTGNRGGLYQTEDSVSACFRFADALPGSGSWCFVAHDSAREDSVEIIGDKGKLHFSVFTYAPIVLHDAQGRQEFSPENPEYVQLPLIRNVVEHLQSKRVCTCDCVSATSVNWVMDRILGKI